MAEEESGKSKSNRLHVGLIYDKRMCNHRAPDGDVHPENPNRITAIWNKLLSLNIPQRCVVLDAKEAEDKYLQLVHSKKHVNLIKNISSKKSKSQLKRIASKFDSIYLSKGSPEAAYIAAGSVIEVAEKVARGELNSAAAIVRPPGHHAEHDEAMGFCLFNNVAVAASVILDEKPELGIKKILIVDWDVHHGNGTQKMFWKDPRALVFSVHRHEFGKFYPCNDDGFYTMIGEGPGTGYNINVPWENGGCGDADYLAVWDHILIPVAKKFNPDMVIVSAGYDAAINDPIGGCCVTPYGYSALLKKLMEFGNGKIVLALEGGYNLDSLSNSIVACMEVLLESKPIDGSSEACPLESTWRVILQVRKKLSEYWPVLATELPLKLANKKSPPVWGKMRRSQVGLNHKEVSLDMDLTAGERSLVKEEAFDRASANPSSELDGEKDMDQVLDSLRDDALQLFIDAARLHKMAFYKQRQLVEARATCARLERTIKELEQELAELKMGKEAAKRARTDALMVEQMRKMEADHQQALNEMKQRVANLEQDKSNLALSNAQLVDKNGKLEKSLGRAHKKNGRYKKKLELTVSRWKGSICQYRAALLTEASALLSRVELECDFESSNDDGVSSDTSSISSEEEE